MKQTTKFSHFFVIGKSLLLCFVLGGLPLANAIAAESAMPPSQSAKTPESVVGSTGDINIVRDPSTGALSTLTIQGDNTEMNWLIATDGSQYPWVTSKYGWGLGNFTEWRNHNTELRNWQKPMAMNDSSVTYKEGDIQIDVQRKIDADGDLVETYTFENVGKEVACMEDVSIYLPLNDNYPDSKTCVNSRTNVHIWPGDNYGWINAMRMGGYAPHLGLMVSEGSITGYEILERGLEKGNSQYRGIFAVNLPDIWLKPSERYTLQWKLFSHDGNQDFAKKLLKNKGVLIDADKYVVEVGDSVKVVAQMQPSMQRRHVVSAKVNGCPSPVKEVYAGYETVVKPTYPSEINVEFTIDGKSTSAELLAISGEQSLIDKRLAFIREHQQMNKETDPRFGAYMIYDCEGDSIYLNDTPNCNPVDRDEGAERVGMGVLMAKKYRLTGDEEIGNSVKRYAKFVREKLQTLDYVTYSSVDHKRRNRGYNYMWVAELYFQLYMATGEKQYAVDGYNTLQAMFRQFGYGFYAIGIPVNLGLEALQKAGMKKERSHLLADFKKVGDTMVKNGLNYPPFEVNYEQSIVAPAIQFLCQLYMQTHDKKYLDEVERQLPVLEAFNGFQPCFHLNDIAIRHWDGFWFGKRELFGDTFPHYWSTITAAAFYYYYQITDDELYKQRAENIVRNNLCLFFEDGKASCAYLYPDKITGINGKFYDPYANDQDWALVYYMLVHNNI